MQIIIWNLFDRAVPKQLRKRCEQLRIVQPAKPAPDLKLYNYKDWRQSGVSKGCYYGIRRRRDEKAFWRINTRIFQEGKIASSFTWLHHMPTGSSDAFYGTNATGEASWKKKP